MTVFDELLGRLKDVQCRAEAMAHRARVAEKAASVPHFGTDDTESVLVVLVASGAIGDVEVDPEWRGQLGPDELGEAVCAAADRATSARAVTFAEAFEAATGDAAEVPSDVDGPSGGTNTLPATVPSGFLGALCATVPELLQDVAFARHATHTAISRAGHATATVTADGAVTDVRYDMRWLVNAHEFTIGLETAEAVRLACRAADEHSAAAAVAQSRFTRLLTEGGR